MSAQIIPFHPPYDSPLGRAEAARGPIDECVLGIAAHRIGMDRARELMERWRGPDGGDAA